MSQQYLIKQFDLRPFKPPTSATSPGGYVLKNRRNAVDFNTSTFAHHASSTYGTSINTPIDYVFEDPLAHGPEYDGSIFIAKIRVKQDHANGGEIRIVHSGGTYTKTFGDAASFTYIDIVVLKTFYNITSITVILNTEGTSSNESKLYDVRIQGSFGPPDFEFNDSVLETKGWNSSRYDGRQLQASGLNISTRDDIGNNSRTPILQKYTRNIYIGNDIIGMTAISSSVEVEDPNIVQFPDFSYAQTNFYITVNEDNSITRNELDIQDTNNTQKIGFYRSFYDDFPQGGSCNLILGDPTVKSSLKQTYRIFFNGGQLQKLIELDPLGASEMMVATTQSVDCYILTGSETIYQNSISSTRQGAFYLNLMTDFGSGTGSLLGTSNASLGSGFAAQTFNENIYSSWFTGSMTTKKPGVFSAFAQQPTLKFDKLSEFSDNFFKYKNGSAYKGDKRLFITLTHRNIINDAFHSEQQQPLYTFQSGSFASESRKRISDSGGVLTNTLIDLSTAEISSFRTQGPFAIAHVGVEPKTAYSLEYKLSLNNNWHFAYRSDRFSIAFDGVSIDQGEPRHFPFFNTGSNAKNGDPISFHQGGVMISKVNDDVPSLLINLKKEIELPNGKGNNTFVIIPENLHPYIKDNLLYFLTRAGINLGGDTSPLIELNESNRNLK